MEVINPTDVNCSNGVILIKMKGGTGNQLTGQFEYFLDDLSYGVYGSVFSFEGVSSGVHRIKVLHNTTCVYEDIVYMPCESCTIPQGFTQFVLNINSVAEYRGFRLKFNKSWCDNKNCGYSPYPYHIRNGNEPLNNYVLRIINWWNDNMKPYVKATGGGGQVVFEVHQSLLPCKGHVEVCKYDFDGLPCDVLVESSGAFPDINQVWYIGEEAKTVWVLFETFKYCPGMFYAPLPAPWQSMSAVPIVAVPNTGTCRCITNPIDEEGFSVMWDGVELFSTNFHGQQYHDEANPENYAIWGTGVKPIQKPEGCAYLITNTKALHHESDPDYDNNWSMKLVCDVQCCGYVHHGVVPDFTQSGSYGYLDGFVIDMQAASVANGSIRVVFDSEGYLMIRAHFSDGTNAAYAPGALQTYGQVTGNGYMVIENWTPAMGRYLVVTISAHKDTMFPIGISTQPFNTDNTGGAYTVGVRCPGYHVPLGAIIPCTNITPNCHTCP